MMPLGLLRVVDTRPALRVQLFKRYTEKEAAPFVNFMAELKPRAGGGPPPPVTMAELHVKLQLGWIRSLLYLVRHLAFL